MGFRRPKKQWNSHFLLPLAAYLFLVSSLLFLCASVMLRSYNNNLCARKQKVEQEVTSLTQQNEETERDISNLSSAERVAAIAKASLSYQANNIISVQDGQ